MRNDARGSGSLRLSRDSRESEALNSGAGRPFCFSGSRHKIKMDSRLRGNDVTILNLSLERASRWYQQIAEKQPGDKQYQDREQRDRAVDSKKHVALRDLRQAQETHAARNEQDDAGDAHERAWPAIDAGVDIAQGGHGHPGQEHTELRVELLAAVVRDQ